MKIQSSGPAEQLRDGGGAADALCAPVLYDARMIRHSGIGAHIRESLGALLGGQWPANQLTLLGTRRRLRSSLAPAALARARIEPFHAPLYSPREQIEAAARLARLARLARDPAGPAAPGAIVHWPHYNFPLAWRGPLVVTVHDLIHSDYPPRPGVSLYQRFFLMALRRRLRRAGAGGPPALALTVSRHSKVILQRRWRFPASRVWMVGNGVAPVFRAPRNGAEARAAAAEVRRALGLPARFWLTVGIFKPHKNYPWLLRALEELWESGAFRGAGLVMAGTRRPRALRRLIESDPRLRGRVWLLGELSTETLRALYWSAEALIFPSLAEGFGLPVVEAMACGAPVICSRRPPMTEIARGAAGFFEPDSPGELFRRLREVTPDSPAGAEPPPPRPERETPSGEAAARQAAGLAAAREHTWESTATRIAEAWRQITRECAAFRR